MAFLADSFNDSSRPVNSAYLDFVYGFISDSLACLERLFGHCHTKIWSAGRRRLFFAARNLGILLCLSCWEKGSRDRCGVRTFDARGERDADAGGLYRILRDRYQIEPRRMGDLVTTR